MPFGFWLSTLLVIIPFSKLRAEQRPIKYSVFKISNVVINMLLNVFLLGILPKLAQTNPEGFWSTFYFENYQIGYVFLANLIASLFTFVLFMPHYFQPNWLFNKQLWVQMLKYGWPILFAGLAFGINEHLDKILLSEWLDPATAKLQLEPIRRVIKSACLWFCFERLIRWESSRFSSVKLEMQMRPKPMPQLQNIL